MTPAQEKTVNNFFNFQANEGIATFLTVDPGFNTGAALWALNSGPRGYAPMTQFFTVPKMAPVDKVRYAWDRFETILEALHPDRVYIESTELWQDNLTSLTSGSSGDLLTLTILIGGYAHACFRRSLPFVLIPAQGWKGQMNKKVVQRRVFREIGTEYPNDHLSDAVGIGLSLINNWRVSV